MTKAYGKDILRFVILVVLQVFILDHINLGGYINPSLYVLFILLLPFETPGWLLLVSSFLIGFSIDSFGNTTGLHAGASVFMAFLRPWAVRLAGAPAEYEGNLKPGIADMGFRWFFGYTLVLVMAHQFALSMLEAFRFAEIGYVLLRTLAGGAFTIVLIIIAEYLFMSKRK